MHVYTFHLKSKCTETDSEQILLDQGLCPLLSNHFFVQRKERSQRGGHAQERRQRGGLQ